MTVRTATASRQSGWAKASRYRGVVTRRATALLFFSTNLIGLGIGPALTGFLSDRFGIVAALSLSALLYLWAAGHFLLGSRTIARDLAA